MRPLAWLFCLGGVLVAACETTDTHTQRNGLPAFARSLRVVTTIAPAELSGAVKDTLQASGFEGRGEQLILTQPAPLGELSMRILVELEGSTATASSEFSVLEAGEPLWRIARNAPGPGEAVFLRMVEVLSELPHSQQQFLLDR